MNDLYIFPKVVTVFAFSVNNSSFIPMLTSYNLWHSRVGHVNANVIH